MLSALTLAVIPWFRDRRSFMVHMPEITSIARSNTMHESEFSHVICALTEIARHVVRTLFRVTCPFKIPLN